MKTVNPWLVPAFLLLTSITISAQASTIVYVPHYCYPDSTTRLVAIQVIRYHDAACIAGLPLKLATMSQTYARMQGRSFEVEYWQGSYFKPALLQNTYACDLYDTCTGGSEGSEYYRGPVYEGQAEFTVDNPSLHEDISQSFAHVPMTDGEPRAALEAQKTACARLQNPIRRNFAQT